MRTEATGMATSPTPAAPANPFAPARLYEIDCYTWAMQQAAAVRGRDHAAIDWENVAEELEGLARAEARLWTNLCGRAIEHLLKIEYYDCPTDRVLRHWQREVEAFRHDMADTIRDNPGLLGRYGELYARAWRIGRRKAANRLTEYTESNVAEGLQDPISGKKLHHLWDRRLPRENPYAQEHVAAFDLRRDADPRGDVFPPGVAARLNAQLGRDYEIRRGPPRGPYRSHGLSR